MAGSSSAAKFRNFSLTCGDHSLMRPTFFSKKSYCSDGYVLMLPEAYSKYWIFCESKLKSSRDLMTS